MILFFDGSVNPKSNIGYGAYLAVTDHGLSIDTLKSKVKVKRFVNTSSSQLELQTLLWALSDIHSTATRLTIYTDSQSVMKLKGRRARIENNDYRTNKNTHLNNRELYQEFYRMTDQLDCELVKVRGHRKSDDKDDIDNLFTLVDRASRKALRNSKI